MPGQDWTNQLDKFHHGCPSAHFVSREIAYIYDDEETRQEV